MSGFVANAARVLAARTLAKRALAKRALAKRTLTGRTLTGPGAKPAADAGFTLVETMLAGALGLSLALPAYAMLNNTYRSATLLNSRFARDAQARQVLALLGEGSSSFGTVTDPRGFTMVEGLRSHASIPSPYTLTSNGQFVMPDVTAITAGLVSLTGSGPSISGDAVPSTTITCTASGVPLPACTGTGTITTQGWMGASPVLLQTGRTVAVEITVSDPYQARQQHQTAGNVTDTYRTLFNLNVEANP